jgi:hypothetical protein
VHAKTATAVVVIIATFALIWIAMPGIRGAVPVWIVVDALVAQIVIVTALSGALRNLK